MTRCALAESLVSALIKASKAYADPIAAAYASGNRPYTVLITRAAAEPGFDRDTGQFQQSTRGEVYNGPARIYASPGGAELDIGDERTSFNSATITIDNTDGPQPRVGDQIRVQIDAQSEATHIAYHLFDVTGVEVGGHYGVGWTLQTLGVSPGRHD